MAGSEFSGAVALVTGSASGIGSAVTDSLRQEGARVAACDVASSITDSTNGYRLDVTDPGAVERVVTAVENDLGPIDVLVNTAGVMRSGPLTELSDADFAAVFAVNTTGVFNVTRAVTTRMRARARGAVVTVASDAGAVPRQHIGAYAASKSASAHLTKCFGLELAGHGIRCNVVSPGSTDTPMLRSVWGDDVAKAVDGNPAAFRIPIPLRKVATPQDVADTVCFLASRRASHLTMQELFVDGGASLR